MVRYVVRITPTKQFTLNNRWYNNVWPKHTLFFMPNHYWTVRAWINWLCWKHHRTYLYAHYVRLESGMPRMRILAYYKKIPLIEYLVRDRSFVTCEVLKTRLVRKTKLKLATGPGVVGQLLEMLKAIPYIGWLAGAIDAILPDAETFEQQMRRQRAKRFF